MVKSQPATLIYHDMGSGKTFTTITAIVELRPRLVLIVCPKPVMNVWPREFDKYGAVGIHCESLAARRSSDTLKQRAQYAKDAIARHDGTDTLVLIVNYEAAWQGDLGKFLASQTWDMVICDESHRIKSAAGKASRYLSNIKAEKRIALTGTPLPHSPLDAYAQFRFLDKRIFGTSNARFKARYAIMGGYSVNGRPVKVIDFQNMDEFNTRFYSITHRFDGQLIDAQQIDVPLDCELTGDAKRIYNDIEDNLIAEVDAGIVTAANAMVKLIRLQQAASGFVKCESGSITRLTAQDKYDRLLEWFKDIPEEEPVVIFCRFHEELNTVFDLARERKRPFDELSGRQNTVGPYWEPQPGAIAAVQIQAGGVGIDLTQARYAIYFSQTFNLGDYEQSRKRLHRPGQERNVYYYHLLPKSTIDVRIQRVLKKRGDLIENVLRDMTQEALAHG